MVTFGKGIDASCKFYKNNLILVINKWLTIKNYATVRLYWINLKKIKIILKTK